MCVHFSDNYFLVLKKSIKTRLKDNISSWLFIIYKLLFAHSVSIVLNSQIINLTPYLFMVYFDSQLIPCKYIQIKVKQNYVK